MLDAIVTDDFRAQPLTDIVAAPVTALVGVSSEAAELLAAQFRIATVGQLGKNILFRFAQAMVVMGGVKNDAQHSDWGERPIRDVLDEPPTVIKYVSADQASALHRAFGVTSVRSMGTNPQFLRAQAIVALAETR